MQQLINKWQHLTHGSKSYQVLVRCIYIWCVRYKTNENLLSYFTENRKLADYKMKFSNDHYITNL